MGMEKITVAERRLLARQVGNELVRTHGKKKHYTVPEVKAAARRQKTPEYWDCWALCLYTSRWLRPYQPMPLCRMQSITSAQPRNHRGSPTFSIPSASTVWTSIHERERRR